MRKGHKNLKTSAVVGEASNAIEGLIDELLANGVVTTGVVVCGILLASDELLRVEELLVCSRSALIWKFHFMITKLNVNSFLTLSKNAK